MARRGTLGPMAPSREAGGAGAEQGRSSLRRTSAIGLRGGKEKEEEEAEEWPPEGPTSGPTPKRLLKSLT